MGASEQRWPKQLEQPFGMRCTHPIHVCSAAQGLDAEHLEVPLGIYSTALEAALVYARHARSRGPQVAPLSCQQACPTTGLGCG